MEGLLKNYDVKNIICETKKTGDVAYKQKVINCTPVLLFKTLIFAAFLDKNYNVYSYAEHYFYNENNPMSLAVNVKESALVPLTHLTEDKWIPYEDLFYTNQKSELRFDQ